MHKYSIEKHNNLFNVYIILLDDQSIENITS